MKSFSALALAMSATLASAQVYQCNGARRPNWEDCATVVSDFNMDGNPEPFHDNGVEDPAPSCKWWFKNGGNCRITHCYQDTNPGTISGGQIFQLYDAVRSRCVDFRAGGEFTGALQFLNVYNDEDQAPAPPRKRSSTTYHEGGLVEETMTLEEYRQWENDTLAIQDAKRNAAILNSRQVEGDDTVYIDFEALNIRNPDAFELGPRLGNGVGYSYETTESETYGVTSSVNVGGAWEIFTASVGIETSYEQTYSITEGLQFDVPCQNQGQVTFYPFYNYYETRWSPSGVQANIYVPVVTGDNKINGEIAVACLG